MSKIVLAAAAVLVLGSAGLPAMAAETQPAQSLNVAAVDFRDQAAVRGFYAELKDAAYSVCADRPSASENAACARQAVADAVRRLDRPALTALYGRDWTRQASPTASAMAGPNRPRS